MLEIRLFGTLELRVDGTPVVVPSSRAQSLLAYLVLQHGVPQRRERLAFLLWPDSSEKQARTNLRHVVHTVRTAVPDADRFLRSTSDTLAWDGSSADVTAFEQAVAASEGTDAVDAIDRLRAAVDLYTDDLLTGWFDEWVPPERERLRRRATGALDRLVPLLAARGELGAAIRYGERARALDPLAESTYRSLMQLYDRRGDRARALRVYHEGVATLRDELGVEPSPATRATYEALLPTAADAPEVPSGRAFVGRQGERRQLTDRWREATRGRAGLVLIVGEPGIGKTRLIENVRQWAAHHGAATATARSYAAEGALSYAPIASWLRAPPIARWRGRVDAAHRAYLARLLPETSDEATPGDPGLDETEARFRLFDAAARTLLAGPDPVLLVADDLHAADVQTLQFLHFLIRSRPAGRMLVLATARLAETDADDPLHTLLTGLRGIGRCSVIELDRLDAADTAQLATHTATRALSPADTERLYAETAGNPLFVVETLRAGWPDTGRPDGLTPRTQAVLEARLLHLTPGARDLLGLAATVGTSIPVDVLNRSRPGDEDAVGRDLDELWRRQLLLARGAETYDFSHDKLREVAYRTLSPALRRRNHRALADVLQAVYHDRLDAVAGQIAAHLQGGGSAGEATDWYVRAADVARRVYADADAAHHLDQALGSVRSTPASPERQARELELLTAQLGPLAAAEGYASSRLAAALDAALELARQLGTEPSAPLLRAHGMAALAGGDADAARQLGAQLVARGRIDDILAVEGEFVQGVTAYWRGDLDGARGHLEAAVARYRPENRAAHLSFFAQDPYVLSLARLANVHFFGGDVVEARRLQRESVELAREISQPFTLAVALLFAALLDLELADLDALRHRIAELSALRHRVEFPAIRLFAEAMSGFLEVVDGGTDVGLTRIDATLVDPERVTAPGVPAMLLRIRLAACERAGDAAGVTESAERLLADDVRVWDAAARTALRAER